MNSSLNLENKLIMYNEENSILKSQISNIIFNKDKQNIEKGQFKFIFIIQSLK